MLEAASYAPERLRAHAVDEAFRNAWETVAHRSEELYRPMERDVIELDDDSRLPTLSSLYLYRGILDEVRADGYRCFEHRVVVSKATARELVDEALAALEEGKR